MVNPLRQTLEDDLEHDFSTMGEGAIIDIASFLQEGLIDLTAYIAL
jgi:hypothetical protein